jgi:hypothetical protein
MSLRDEAEQKPEYDVAVPATIKAELASWGGVMGISADHWSDFGETH